MQSGPAGALQGGWPTCSWPPPPLPPATRRAPASHRLLPSTARPLQHTPQIRPASLLPPRAPPRTHPQHHSRVPPRARASRVVQPHRQHREARGLQAGLHGTPVRHHHHGLRGRVQVRRGGTQHVAGRDGLDALCVAEDVVLLEAQQVVDQDALQLGGAAGQGGAGGSASVWLSRVARAAVVMGRAGRRVARADLDAKLNAKALSVSSCARGAGTARRGCCTSRSCPAAHVRWQAPVAPACLHGNLDGTAARSRPSHKRAGGRAPAGWPRRRPVHPPWRLEAPLPTALCLRPSRAALAATPGTPRARTSGRLRATATTLEHCRHTNRLHGLSQAYVRPRAQGVVP